jgi:hypothetical protein
MILGTENGAVRQTVDFDAIGMGATFAKSILHNYWLPMCVESAVLLSAYTINRVKFSVANCGKETHIMVMRDGVAKHLPHTLIEEFERFLGRLAQFHSDSFRFLFGFGPEAEGGGLQQESDRLRHEIKAITSGLIL